MKNHKIPGEAEIELPKAVCPLCGAGDLQITDEREEFWYGQGPDRVKLSATVPVCTCATCSGQFYLPEAEDAKHEAVCAHIGVMSPKQIIALRAMHQMSRVSFVELSMIGEATLGRWERGELIQNRANDQFLYLLGFEDNVQRLQGRRRPTSFPSLVQHQELENSGRIAETVRAKQSFFATVA